MNNTNSPIISVVLPTLNEADGIKNMLSTLIDTLKKTHHTYEIIIVDDNSQDSTISEIKKFQACHHQLKYIQMSRRFGDQPCLLAGLQFASGSCVIVMDADLQHPPKYIPEMISQWENGYQVVLMQRQVSGQTNIFKKTTEIAFYKTMKFLSDSEIFYRFSGFCLLDKDAVQALLQHKESSPFLRGLIGLIGFNKKVLPYTEDFRKEGKSKYNITRMIKLAANAVLSFSGKPLLLSTFLGFFVVSISGVYGSYIFYMAKFNKISVNGWSSLMLITLFLGGCQLISTGIIGLYLSRIFYQVKERPNYIIKTTSGFKNTSQHHRKDDFVLQRHHSDKQMITDTFDA